MAPDGRHERVRGALAVALGVFLTYKKQRRARILAEWALVLDVLEDILYIETTEGTEGEDGDGRWSPRQQYSASPPTIGFFTSPVVYSAQESRAETPRLQGAKKLSQALPRIPYEFFSEPVKLGKQRKRFSLAAVDVVAGRQSITVELKISRS